MLGYKLDSDGGGTQAATSTSGLPAAVEETRVQLPAAAEAGDYEAVAELIPTTGFEYTFGGPVDGGPPALWQELEAKTDERPLETLAAILKMPYVLSRGNNVWPWAFTVESSDDLSPHEVKLLAPVGSPSEFFPEGIGYLSWRAGVARDGTWAFFVAGD